jgi:tripartite-type tricarboxylate transporter receptor subunit TctC
VKATRRTALLLPAALLARPAIAQRPMPLTLVVGASGGSAPDRWARGFAPFLERHWPRSSVSVANLAGDGGLVAVRAIADALPDGRAIGAVATPALIARAVETDATAMLDRLDFLGAVTEELVVLVVAPGIAPDLATLRGIGDRGRIGCPPTGSAAQLAANMLATALPLAPIAFPSAGTARQAVIAGNLTAALLPLPDAITALRENKFQAVAIAAEARSPLLPELPLFTEIGLPVVPVTQRGFAMPKGVPEMMRHALAEALESVLADPEFTAQNAAQGRTPHLVPAAAWDAQLRALTLHLRQRWQADPWVRRG